MLQILQTGRVLLSNSQAEEYDRWNASGSMRFNETVLPDNQANSLIWLRDTGGGGEGIW